MSEDSTQRPARQRRIAVWLGWSALAIVGVGLAWIVVTALLARARLNEVRAELPQLRTALSSGQYDRAQELARRIEDHTASAHALTGGPAWWVSANLPVLGTPLQTTRTVTAEADRVAGQVVPGVLDLANRLSTGGLVRHDTVDIAALRTLAPQLHSAAQAAQLASDNVSAAAPSWLSPVSKARGSFATELGQLRGELEGADRAVRVLLPMLGEHGQQRYFVGFMNEAEARGAGGIPGSFAIVTADHGHITFEHFGSDLELAKVHARVNLGAEFSARYGHDDPQGLIANSDISPEFSYAGRIWAGMWQAKTGEHVDGALALDPTALRYLLQVTGPAKLASGELVSADNVVALTQQGQYARYRGDSARDNVERKQYLTSVARAVSAKITGGGDPTQLVRALTRAAGERRLLVWSADAATQRDLHAADWSGSLQPAQGSRAGFAVVNAAGSKLDYYLDRTLTFTRSSCGTDSSAVATLRLHNDAPTSGLPPYVTIRADKRPGTKPGDNHLLVSFYAPAGSRIEKVTVDGRAAHFGVQSEAGSVVTTLDLELPRQSARTISVTASGPAFAGDVGILAQPLARPLQVSATHTQCG